MGKENEEERLNYSTGEFPTRGEAQPRTRDTENSIPGAEAVLVDRNTPGQALP